MDAMRGFLIAVFSAILLSGTSAAMAGGITGKAAVVATGNILDKLIVVINGYTGKVGAAVSMEEVEAVYAEFEQTIASFTKENAGEIAKFDARLTDKMKADYAAELAKAIRRFKAALEKKAMEFLGE